jgi:sugar lactone lactonase YvrE
MSPRLCVLALAVIGLACSNTELPPGNGNSEPSFDIKVEPTTLSLAQGGTAEVTVRISHSGKPEPIVLDLVAPPQGLTAQRVVVSEGEQVGVLRLAATRELEVRSYGVDLSASGTSGKRHRRFTVNVRSHLGALEVSIQGTPVSGRSVRIQGPGGFDQTVSSSQVLQGLTPGEYQVSASPVFEGSRYAYWAYDATVRGGGRVLVMEAAQSQVQVDYALRQGSGSMWLLDTTANALIGWSDGELYAGLITDTSIGLEGNAGVGAVAIDAAGNLWVTLQGANAIARYDTAQLQTSGNKAPAAVLEGIDSPEGLGFDVAGNLWTASGDAVWKLAAADLPASGRRMATPVLRLRGGMTAPRLAAFDSTGSLYVLSRGDGRLVRFAVAQLSATGEVTTTPEARIRSTGALESPTGFAFNAEGDLLIANQGTPAFLARFRAAQLQVTGEAELQPHLRLFSDALQAPSAVAFDLQGGVWVADAGSPRVSRFSQAQLTGSGDVTVSAQRYVFGESGYSSSQRFSAVAFSAPPAGLPLP